MTRMRLYGTKSDISKAMGDLSASGWQFIDEGYYILDEGDRFWRFVQMRREGS